MLFTLHVHPKISDGAPRIWYDTYQRAPRWPREERGTGRARTRTSVLRSSRSPGEKEAAGSHSARDPAEIVISPNNLLPFGRRLKGTISVGRVAGFTTTKRE